MTQRAGSQRTAASRRVTARRRYGLVEAWRGLTKGLLDPYRPELHYMRGPGPKWREKHAIAAADLSGCELARAAA
jgi:hypothetical protein